MAESEAAGVIDLRSDTVTRPTPGMREAIAGADVGDDALDGDPTVERLEGRIAELLGKDRALFVPSGIMGNQIALRLWTEPGTEVVAETTAHVFDWEEAAAAEWSGVQIRPVATEDGLLDAGLVEGAIRSGSRYQPRTSLVCVENTHNAAGGRVLGLEAMRGIRKAADEHALPVHLDGARLWNASVASGASPAAYAECADSVMVTLSKGLGCPVGSLLAGPGEAMEAAWRVRRRLGGGMRQAGVLAAAGLYALGHHVDRLAEDHANARLLAELVAEIPGLDVTDPETNIVMIDMPDDEALKAGAFLEALVVRGVRMSRFAERRLRAVTHKDVDEGAIRRAAEALAEAVAESRGREA